MKRDPFRATIERRNAHEDKMWKRYADKPAYTNWMVERFPDRIGAIAERNMQRCLKRIREMRNGHE